MNEYKMIVMYDVMVWYDSHNHYYTYNYTL